MNKQRFMCAVAVHTFLIRDNKILLLRRFNTGYEDGNFSVPAGHVDGDEPIKLAAIREAKEEIGIDVCHGNVEIISVVHRKTSIDERIDFFLLVKDWAGDIQNMEEDKCDLLEWHDIEKLPENTIPYIKRAIENYKANVTFDIYGW